MLNGNVFWLTEEVKSGEFDMQSHPRRENLADYFTQISTSNHHRDVGPWYVHEQSSPRELPRAAILNALQGYV